MEIKRIAAGALAAAMLLAFAAGCGGKKDPAETTLEPLQETAAGETQSAQETAVQPESEAKEIE